MKLSFKGVLVCGLLMLVLSASAQIPDTLPLLVSDFALGTTFYGGGDVPQDDILRERVTDAAAQGMNAFTFYVDWADIETTPGQYDLDGLEASLTWLHGLGIQPLLNLTLIDIADVNLPDTLTLTHPQLMERLNRLLDRVVPLLVANGGFLLLLGNEVDGYFSETEDTNALDAYARLIAAAREHIRTLAPELAIGVTLTSGEVIRQGATFQALQPVTDILPFNFYALDTSLDGWFTVSDDSAMREALGEVIAVYGDAPIVIPELGCPSARVNGSSLARQAECFSVLFEILQTYPNVRYVTVFTLFDLDAVTCEAIVRVFGVTETELPQPYFDRWRGYLCTLGLLDADYMPKPAWDVFIGALP